MHSAMKSLLLLALCCALHTNAEQTVPTIATTKPIEIYKPALPAAPKVEQVVQPVSTPKPQVTTPVPVPVLVPVPVQAAKAAAWEPAPPAPVPEPVTTESAEYKQVAKILAEILSNMKLPKSEEIEEPQPPKPLPAIVKQVQEVKEKQASALKNLKSMRLTPKFSPKGIASKAKGAGGKRDELRQKSKSVHPKQIPKGRSTPQNTKNSRNFKNTINSKSSRNSNNFKSIKHNRGSKFPSDKHQVKSSKNQAARTFPMFRQANKIN